LRALLLRQEGRRNGPPLVISQQSFADWIKGHFLIDHHFIP